MYGKKFLNAKRSFQKNLGESSTSFANIAMANNCFEKDIGNYNPQETKRVKVCVYAGATRIDIRKYFWCNGNLIPTKKGINLTVQEWEDLKKYAMAIDAEIKRLK
jgi:hypothetical protein